MAGTRTRPLSPHLSIWKWGPHMAVSIMNRVVGVGLATVGVIGFVWWLTALAMGKEAYDVFLSWAKWPPMLIFPIGLSWAFFQHLAGGIRHFVLDTGAGFELKTNRFWAIATFVFAIVMTAGMWAYLLLRTA